MAKLLSDLDCMYVSLRTTEVHALSDLSRLEFDKSSLVLLQLKSKAYWNWRNEIEDNEVSNNVYLS